MTEPAQGDMFAAGGAVGGAADTYDGYSYQAPDPYANIGAIDPSTFSAMFGAGGAPGGMAEPEYLHYEPKSWGDRMFYNTGTAYLLGIASGGAYGVLNGFSTSPSRKFRIRINSILNKSGRFGSRFGNALGAVAMMYSCFEAATDRVHLDEFIPLPANEDLINPVVAATLTGILYKSTQGPKTMALAGLLGGTAVAGLAGARMAMSRGSGRTGSLFF